MFSKRQEDFRLRRYSRAQRCVPRGGILSDSQLALMSEGPAGQDVRRLTDNAQTHPKPHFKSIPGRGPTTLARSIMPLIYATKRYGFPSSSISMKALGLYWRSGPSDCLLQRPTMAASCFYESRERFFKKNGLIVRWLRLTAPLVQGNVMFTLREHHIPLNEQREKA